MGMFDIYAGSAANLIMALYIGAYFAGIGFFAWAVVMWMKYNVRVIIREKVGTAGERARTYAARKKRSINGEGYDLKTFFGGIRIPWPEAKYTINHQGMRFKTLIEFYKIGDGATDYKPILSTANIDDVTLIASDNDVRMWEEGMHRAKAEKYNTTPLWQKLLPWLGLGLFAIVVLVGSIVWLDKNVKITESNNAALVEISNNAKEMGRQLANIHARNSAGEMGANPETPPDVQEGG